VRGPKLRPWPDLCRPTACKKLMGTASASLHRNASVHGPIRRLRDIKDSTASTGSVPIPWYKAWYSQKEGQISHRADGQEVFV